MHYGKTTREFRTQKKLLRRLIKICMRTACSRNEQEKVQLVFAANLRDNVGPRPRFVALHVYKLRGTFPILAHAKFLFEKSLLSAERRMCFSRNFYEDHADSLNPQQGI